VAQDEDGALAVGETVEAFLREHGGLTGAAHAARGLGLDGREPGLPLRSDRPEGRAHGDAVPPALERAVAAEVASGPQDFHQAELARVLGVLSVPQQGAAEAVHPREQPPNERALRLRVAQRDARQQCDIVCSGKHWRTDPSRVGKGSEKIAGRLELGAVRRVAAGARSGWAADRIVTVSRIGGRASRNIPGVSGLGRSFLRLGACLAVAAGVTVRSGAASGAPDETPPTAALLITFDPASAEQGPVVAAVRAHLRGVPVRVLAEPIPKARSVGQKVATSGERATASGAIGTLSVELAEDGAVLIFFTEPDGSATLIRRLPPNEQGVRTTVEQVAIVVRSLVEALLDGARVGLAPGPTAPPSPEEKDATKSPDPSAPRQAGPGRRTARRPAPIRAPAAVRDEPESDTAEATFSSPAASRAVALTAAYAGAQFATNTRWQSGFTLGVTWRVLPPLYAGARYTFVPELEGGNETTTVAVSRHPAEVTVGYVGASVVAPNAELGLVADRTRRRTRSSAPGYAPTPATSRWMVALGARAGVSWRALEAVALTLRGGADFLLTRYSYVVPPEAAVASPRPIRPRVDLELAVTLW
jgi:hypothetical protein